MKYKTTAKAIRQSGGRVVSVGYCDLTHLLRYHSPVTYACGVYGWNFDVYEVHGLTICTGYRGMVGPTAKNAAEYERKARAIIQANAFRVPLEETRAAVEALLAEFCAQAA